MCHDAIDLGTAGDVTSTVAYDPASQIVTRTRSNDGYAFGDYLTVSRSYAVNGLNQYTSAGPATFGYDANGNLTSDGTTSYGYDVENRLVSASHGATTVAALVYDPQGRLYQTGGGAAGTTRLLYDGDELVAEYASTGAVLRRYVHGPGDDDPLIWYEGAGLSDRRSLQDDQQGSIVSIADSAGTMLAIDSYDEYGIPGAGNIGRFQYTGQAWIPELGMYHYKARIYSPTLGRFLQTDPVGYADQNNLYAYVANDPVNGTDPTGLDGDWRQRVVDTVNGAAEILAGVVIVGGGDGAAGAAEVATLGGATPIAAPVAIGATLTGGAMIADGSRRFMNGIRGSNVSENRRSEQSGSYTNTHESGKTYSGKGSPERSQASGRRVERETGDRHTATEWKPSPSTRDAFKDESRRIDQNGGPKSNENHNRIDSPGAKYRKQDRE